MQGTRFAIRMVAVAVAAALAQGVAAEDYEDENYLYDSDHSYDSFKVTDSDQTYYYAVCVWGSSSLTVNQAFSVSTERKSDVDKQLLGVYVVANSTLEVKGGADISVINSSNLAANNNYIFGLQTEDKVILGGGNDINKISVKNKKGNGHLTGAALTSAGASLGAKSLLVEVVDEASVSRDGNSTTTAQGITHAGGTLTVEDLTVNVTSKGRYNSGILGTAGKAEIGRLKLKVVAGDSESEADSAKAYGLWMEPARGSSPGDYSLSASTMDIEASSLQGGEAYGLYMEMNKEDSPHEVKVSSGATSIRIAKAGAATGVDMVGLAWIFHLDEQHRKKAAFERPSLLPERMGSRLM